MMARYACEAIVNVAKDLPADMAKARSAVYDRAFQYHATGYAPGLSQIGPVRNAV